ncbi:radical SAM protein [Marinicauda algicola]|uniref:Radical SAM protein n=1 Tax=Marinicauda algicola TaxID=2029849 RepID=A0A4S2H154_9PROT|nr:radical SAM protein [Marinicauda algicola]TGY88991.1 radical SAM protein [Marinicauda algicola]
MPEPETGHARLRDQRALHARVHELAHTSADLSARYKAAKQIIRAFRKPAFYEVTQRCNLFCEGCYYFEGGLGEVVRETADTTAWKRFYAEEAARGVTMAYFVGAEPALHQERLLAAAPMFPYGNIGTNGTIAIHPDVPYRIGVSLWAGDDATDRTLRGASVFRKAFRNYEGDPRAIMLFTLSPWNLDTVASVAQMCRDHGLPLTFNMYSPTTTYLAKLAAGAPHDGRYFRVSAPGHTPCFSADDLERTRDKVESLMENYPDTIVYSKAYNAWATRPGPLYDIDPDSGIATHCGSRMIGAMKYYGANLQPKSAKCGTSDVDCSTCRMYSGGWSSKFQPTSRDLQSPATFQAWLEMIEVLGKIFLYRDPHRRGYGRLEAMEAAE